MTETSLLFKQYFILLIISQKFFFSLKHRIKLNQEIKEKKTSENSEIFKWNKKNIFQGVKEKLIDPFKFIERIFTTI